ncbi:MAG: endonuclease/exonuclease/phosphatase family protein [Hyphomicrobium sp.]|nr:endonuclease/exonuclease/phosphatase family protein [Hyphomicrobium sp.]
MRLLGWILTGLGGLAVLATVLPIIPSNEAAIRIWDFPRLQIAALLATVLVATPFVISARSGRAFSFVAVLVAALAWQVHAIWPYTPISQIEAKAVASCEPASQISLLVANVRVENRDAGPLLALVKGVNPDLVLLVETDSRWNRQLEPLKRTYSFVISHPQENGYGMHLFSRYELIKPEVRFLVENDVPSVETGLRLPSGARINLYGLHPRPPPLQDTAPRDAELLLVGEEVRKESTPSIVAGDLNDVAWSRTSSLFQEVSGLLDPRIGRGLYATFNADWPLLRWPLDHVFFAESFWLLDMAVLEDIGSDHFPFFVAVCHDKTAVGLQDEPRPESFDLKAADEIIEEGLE